MLRHRKDGEKFRKLHATQALARLVAGATGPQEASAAGGLSTVGARVVQIGDVELKLEGEERPELVPVGFGLAEEEGQETLSHLKWMLQKFALGQDMFLLSGPGPTARRLAMHFCEVVGLESELVRITRDTTESDLKVRREISGGTATWSDQAPVRAAINGRILILDGIEKAERNVLPTLNNLLENREMALEDGRFLVSAARFDELANQRGGEADIRAASLVRVHPNFRVIALGLPVPKFYGFPLDPPLRSRFQARVVGAFSAERVLAEAGPVPAQEPLRSTVTKLLSMAQTLRAIEDADSESARNVLGGSAGVVHVSDSALAGIVAHLAAFPQAHVPEVLTRYCPYHLLPGSADEAQQGVGGRAGSGDKGGNAKVSYMERALSRFGFGEDVDGQQADSARIPRCGHAVCAASELRCERVYLVRAPGCDAGARMRGLLCCDHLWRMPSLFTRHLSAWPLCTPQISIGVGQARARRRRRRRSPALNRYFQRWTCASSHQELPWTLDRITHECRIGYASGQFSSFRGVAGARTASGRRKAHSGHGYYV